MHETEMEKEDIDKQRGKAQNLEVFSYVQSSHFRLPAQHLCAPSCLTGQQPHPHLHGDVRKDLTCELHSAAILLPPPWSHHRAKQKVSTASACFPPALFSLPQTVWNAEKPELKPVEREQLYSAPWLSGTIAALGGSPPLARSHGMGSRFIFLVPGVAGGAQSQRQHLGWGGRGCGQEEMALKQKHARC